MKYGMIDGPKGESSGPHVKCSTDIKPSKNTSSLSVLSGMEGPGGLGS